MKKILSVVIVLMLILGLLASCKKEAETDDKKDTGTEQTADKDKVETGKTDQEAEKTKQEDSNEKVTIRLLTRMAGTSTQVQIFNDIINQFKEKYPEVEIIDDSQGDESAFNNILTTDIASGEMANIFRIQGVSNLGEYIDNGLLLNVAPHIEKDQDWGGGFSEGSLAYYKVPGHDGIYAVPMEAGLIGVYYNTEIMDSVGYSEFPKTWSELLNAIAKLKEKKIIPIAMGAQSTYMAGHLHDQIFYKWLGTNAAKELGTRQMKWTDDGVVETLQYVKDLIDAGAFDPSAAGITDDVAMTQFQQGEAAMVITGPWNISRFSKPEETPVSDKIKVAKFPYFDQKPENKDEDMQILSPYMISGKLEGKELELTLELVKMLTNKEAAKRYAEESAFLIPRTDIDLDESKCSRLFIENVQLGGTSTGICVDVFDFDPITSMQDRTRNSIVSIFTGATPKQAAEEIQAEIDANTK